MSNPIPAATIKGLTFYPVPEFDDPTVAFGAKQAAFFDRYDLPDIPGSKSGRARELFFSGGTVPDLDPRVDRTKAIRALRAWLGSWVPAHEAKEATVDYALWVWMTPAAIDAALSTGESK